MADVIGGELELIGSHGMAAHAYPELLAELVSGVLAPQRLVQRHIALEAAGAALAALGEQAGPGITLVHPNATS
jgi:alcohol dehydrogenase